MHIMVVLSSRMPPRLGLGMAALGRPGYITLDRSSIFGSTNDKERSIEVMQSAANSVMDTLFELNNSTTKKSPNQNDNSSNNMRPWLDCARSYGLSEKFVGEYLKSNNIAPDQVFVSSKWGYTYVADWQVSLEANKPHEIKDHSTENFLKQLQETREYLGDYLDLYQIHSATFESGILTDTRAHQALAKCRQEHGWAIGLSVSGPQQDEILRQAMKIRVKVDDDDNDSTTTTKSVPLFDSVQCTYNVLEQRPAAALKEAADAGMSTIIKEGLANGRALNHEPVKRYAQQLSCEPDQLALGCILAQPDFTPSVLSGAVTSQQLESNFQALQVAQQLRDNQGLWEEIMKACIVKSEDYWQERAALAWN